MLDTTTSLQASLVSNHMTDFKAFIELLLDLSCIVLKNCFNPPRMAPPPPWIEQLPDQCPPTDATPPKGEVFYRFGDSYPPADAEFCPMQLRYSIANFPVDPCIQKAVSIWSDLQTMSRVCKLGENKTRKAFSFVLTSESGRIKKTGRSGHYSWWRLTGFNPVPTCRLAPI